MAVITITIPDDKNADLVSAVCSNHGYQPTIADPATGKTIDNPMTPAQFASSKLIQWGKEHIDAWKRQVAMQQAAAAVVPADPSDISIVVS
jgi:hypothetical protein